MKSIILLCSLGILFLPTVTTAQSVPYKEYSISVDTRNNFELYAQQIQKLAGDTKSKIEQELQRRNNVKLYEITIRTDVGGFEAIKKVIQTYSKIIDSGLHIKSKYVDTFAVSEEIKRLEIRKQKLITQMDTLSVMSSRYKSLNNELNTVNTSIASKLKKQEENKVQQVIKIKIYENYKKYQRKDNRYRDREWDEYFMPGLGYNRIVPAMKDSFGTFSGFAPEFTIYARYKHYAKGPSYVKTYFRVGILNSDKPAIGKMLLYSVGTNFSFENKMKRQWLIPYFGMEIGGINQKRIGPSLFVMPQLGVYLYASKQLQVHVNGGYLYSFSHPYEYESYTMSAGLSFLLWR